MKERRGTERERKVLEKYQVLTSYKLEQGCQVLTDAFQLYSVRVSVTDTVKKLVL